MDGRLLIAAGAAVCAAGIAAAVVLSHDNDPDPADESFIPTHVPPPAPPGLSVSAMAATYFERYDHDGSGAINLRPQDYDKQIQKAELISVAQAAQLARTDERVTSWRGDLQGDGLTLGITDDLRLLMRAAQNQAGPTGAALGTLELTQPQLEREIAAGWDNDGDSYLQQGELDQLLLDYPNRPGNYRWIRVLHLGEWRVPDDDLPEE